jgi:hypothetical protein
MEAQTQTPNESIRVNAKIRSENNAVFPFDRIRLSKLLRMSIIFSLIAARDGLN